MPDDGRAECDVAIVGAGPAGLSAAIALREAGVAHVVVLEREAEAGGIPRHCGHSPYGLREFRRLMRGPAYAARLVAAARAAGVELRTSVTVSALHPGGRLDLIAPDGPSDLHARRVLLCTGVREQTRAARMIGGTKPGGVVSTAALQGLVYQNRQRPFLNPVILGTELVAFSALLTCRHAGIRPVAMIEPGPRPVARWPAGMLPRGLGIPLHLRTSLEAIHGTSQVTGVDLAGPEGERLSLAADGVIVTGRFLPEASLLRASHLAVDTASGGPIVDSAGRCTDPVYFAAGNLLRPVETAGWCWDEGRRCGQAIARDLAGLLPEPGGEMHLSVAHPALKYVVPQRVSVAAAATTTLQLRVNRAVTGRLCLRQDGADLWTMQVAVLPERRLQIPLGAIAAGAFRPGVPVDITLVEDAT